MADLIANIKALSPSPAAISTVATAGGDINGMISEAQVKAAELYLAINNVIAALPPGDVNLPALESASGSAFIFDFWIGQLFFDVPAQSAYLATVLFR